MARRRKNPADAWLPNRVYRGKSSYEFRPLGGKAIALCRLMRDESKAIIEPPELKRQVIEAWERASIEIRNVQDVDYWLTKFITSNKFLCLSRHTQSDYTRYIEIAVDKSNPKSQATHNGIRYVFGKMQPQAVKPTHIRRYMDYWASPRTVTLDSGKVLASEGKPVTANRHLSCLQSFFKWLRQYVKGMENNPADKIDKFPEVARQVYITDEQYLVLLQSAIDSNTPWVFAFLEIAYLCGLRLTEVCRLNHDDIVRESGKNYLRIIRQKGSRGELVLIEGRLEVAINFAMSLYPANRIEPITNRPIIRNTLGDRISRTAVNSAVRRLRKATGIQDFILHDMKKKAGSDGKDLGHRTKRMADLYNLKLKKDKATR